MKNHTLLLTACFFLVSACNQRGANPPSDKNRTDTGKATAVLQEAAPSSCTQKLVRLIETSSLKESNKSYGDYFAGKHEQLRYSIDNATDTLLLVQVMVRDKKQGDIALCWIQLNLAQDQVADLTTDPDAPVLLHFDKALFASVKKECRFQSNTTLSRD